MGRYQHPPSPPLWFRSPMGRGASFLIVAILLLSPFPVCPSANVLLLPSYTCPSSESNLNHRPVVGILTHPGDGASGRLRNVSGVSYIAASYVKFVESAGARVVPIVYNEPWEAIEEKLNLVNGVLFTGGSAKAGKYYETTQAIFEKVLEKNDAGDYFPLFAICLGFELLNMIVSKDLGILEGFSAVNQASKLQFTTAELEGTVFKRFPCDLLRKMETICLAMQNHKYGISPEKMLGNEALSGFFKILTTSTDSEDKVYVSTAQAYNYPITGLQWHPEKNAFEWGSPVIPHSEDAVQVTQFSANFFISEVRKSLVRPSIEKLLKMLIYNYPPSYSGSKGTGFDEVYIFG